MKKSIYFVLPVLFLTGDILACSSHPGQSHEAYVTSLRKRIYDQPAPSTYSTAIQNTESKAPINSPVSQNPGNTKQTPVKEKGM